MNISDFIAASAGKFVTVTFTKKDGTERKLNGRVGVTKHLKYGPYVADTGTAFCVYDVVNKGYRTIRKDAIKGITCGGLTIINNKVAA
jgi:hypothetical protein